MRRLKEFLVKSAATIARPWYAGIGTILVLHRVVPPELRAKQPDNSALEITPEALEVIIQYFQERRCHFASMDEVPTLLKNGRHTRKFVCLTFDDGYADNAVHAYPILKKHQVPFAINITTSYADHHGLLWWYVLEHVLEILERIQVRSAAAHLDFRLQDNLSRHKSFEQITSLLRTMDQKRRDDLILQLAEQAHFDAYEFSKSYLMNWETIKRMSQEERITFGAHSVHHYTLNRLDEKTARAEIVDSKLAIEARLGREVRHFAYPFGGRNAVGMREFEIARSCGFSTMVTTRCANLFSEHAAYLHCLPRLTLSGNYPTFARLNRLESGLETALQFRGRRVTTE